VSDILARDGNTVKPFLTVFFLDISSDFERAEKFDPVPASSKNDLGSFATLMYSLAQRLGLATIFA